MKRIILSVLLFGLSTTAFAEEKSEPNNEKVVKCYLRYSIDDNSGSVLTSRTNEPTVVPLNAAYVRTLDGLKMQAFLRKVCAADGGPCSGEQDLTVSVSKGKSRATTQFTTPFHSQSIVLQVGDVSVVGTCGYVKK